MEFVDASLSTNNELVYVPPLDYIHVCLVNKGSGTPFISALESRPLKSITYLSPTAPQALFLRSDVVMSTASTSTNDNASMDFGWEAPD
ncbi:unnamed protein product [Prunus brigantina]